MHVITIQYNSNSENGARVLFLSSYHLYFIYWRVQMTSIHQPTKPEFLIPSQIHQLPETGYLRIWQIIGNPKANPPIPAIIPVSRSTWLAWVKSGKAPAPCKLSERTTAWSVESIRAFLVELGGVA